MLGFPSRGFHVGAPVEYLPCGSVFGCVSEQLLDFFYRLTKRLTCTSRVAASVSVRAFCRI